MKASRRRIGLGAALLALFIAVPAAAQENIDAGKTPAQLYAQDCAICHKTPHGLSRAGGLWGLQNFLREHYTASKESAAAIAAYLAASDRKAPPHPRARVRHAPKSEKAKKAGAKLPPRKPAEAKAEAKSKPEADAKPKAETKPESKPAEAKEKPKPDGKPEEAKAAPEPKSESKSKPVEAKTEAKAGAKTEAKAEAKTNGAKAPAGKPEKKAD